MSNSKIMVVWVENVFELGWLSNYKLVKHCYKHVSAMCFLPFFFMGYRNWKSLSEQCQNRLLENLHVLLDECNCLSLKIWVENILPSARFRHVASDEENTLHCLDKDDDLISVSFLAIIDVKGEYSHILLFFFFLKVKNKWVFLFFFLFLKNFIYIWKKDISSFGCRNDSRNFLISSIIVWILWQYTIRGFEME